MRLPSVRAGILLQQDQDDFFLVDTEGGDVFEVNATAARLFSLCQGGDSYESALAALSAGLSVPGQEAEIELDVRETVQRFQELGICEPDAPAA